MDYRVSQNYVRALEGNLDAFIVDKVSMKKNLVTFWGSRLFDLSGFSSLFSPAEETYWEMSYLQGFTE